MESLLTPMTLWKNFDANAEVLDVEIIKTEYIDGVEVEHIYFCGRHFDSEQSRVYAVIAKSSKKALVVAGKYDAAIEVADLVYWAKKGYTAIGIDYAGDLGEGLHTIYPEPIEYANYTKAGRHLTHVDTDAFESCWYEYSLNTMRAVTCIVDYYGIDGDIFLYSYGKSARIATHCLAFDKRIKSATIVYGEILEDYKDDSDRVIDGIEAEVEIMDEEERWLAGICPQSYLQLIEQPIYLILGANSTNINFDVNLQAMTRLPNKKSRALLVAGMLDTVTYEVKDTIDRWFVNVDVPELPQIELKAVEGEIFANVQTTARGFTVWYARGEKKRRFNWVRPIIERNEKGGKAKLEIFDENSPLTVYVNADFDGLWISSEIEMITPKELGKNLKTISSTRMIYEQKMRMAEFISIDTSCEPIVSDKDVVSYKKGYLGMSGIAGKKFGTFAITENMILRHFESVLLFDVYSEKPQYINVCIVQNWATDKQCKYSYSIKLLGGNLWQKVVVEAQDFRSTTGKSLVGDDVTGLDLLAFSSDEEIIITNIMFT